jgi:FAD/FMN-containing dehydrogenase
MRFVFTSRRPLRKSKEREDGSGADKECIHMINLSAKMNKILALDPKDRTIKVEGGVTFTQIN